MKNKPAPAMQSELDLQTESSLVEIKPSINQTERLGRNWAFLDEALREALLPYCRVKPEKFGLIQWVDTELV